MVRERSSAILICLAPVRCIEHATREAFSPIPIVAIFAAMVSRSFVRQFTTHASTLMFSLTPAGGVFHGSPGCRKGRVPRRVRMDPPSAAPRYSDTARDPHAPGFFSTCSPDVGAKEATSHRRAALHARGALPGYPEWPWLAPRSSWTGRISGGRVTLLYPLAETGWFRALAPRSISDGAGHGATSMVRPATVTATHTGAPRDTLRSTPLPRRAVP